MDSRPPDPRPPHSPQYTGPVSYQSPGAHLKSQWITDDQGVGGRVLVIVLIVVSVLGAILGGVIAVATSLLGWW